MSDKQRLSVKSKVSDWRCGQLQVDLHAPVPRGSRPRDTIAAICKPAQCSSPHSSLALPQLGAEIRRFPFNVWKATNFDEFKTELERLHCLSGIPFFIYYIDPTHGDLLPINNNDNFGLALANCSANQRCLKLHLQTKGACYVIF